MPYEDVKEKDILREGDLVLIDAIPSPDQTLGRSLRTGSLVDIAGLKIMAALSKKILNENENSKDIYENMPFICKFQRGGLTALNGAELLDLMINPDAERNRGKIDKEIVNKPHMRMFFYAIEYEEKHKDEGD